MNIIEVFARKFGSTNKDIDYKNRKEAASKNETEKDMVRRDSLFASGPNIAGEGGEVKHTRN